MLFWAAHGHPFRASVGLDQDPPMCLDAQGGINGKRQPFVVGVVLKSCGHGRGRRDVLSRTFCQILELRILTKTVPLKRCKTCTLKATKKLACLHCEYRLVGLGWVGR